MATKLFHPNRRTHLAKGQSLVEFALAATVMIFLLLATIDFGLAFFSWITLRDAAQEGATFASINPPVAGDGGGSLYNIRTRVRYAATTPVNLTGLADDHIQINVFKPDGTSATTGCQGYSAQVTVTYDYQVLTPMISNFIGSPTIPVSATVTDTILKDGADPCP